MNPNGDAIPRGIALPGQIAYRDANAMERSMLDCLCAEPRPVDQTPILAAIWQTERSIILPSGMLQREGVKRAAEISRAGGWPIHERSTGGDVTPQFEGVLNISLGFILSGKERNIEAAYRCLTDPIISFLRMAYGFEAYTASVKGAFCDGTYNLVVGGRKIAGTAQRWRVVRRRQGVECADTQTPNGSRTDPNSDPKAGAADNCKDALEQTAVLGHAALLIGNDLAEALEASNAFFKAWGSDRRIDPHVHVTLEELVGPKASAADQLAPALAHFLYNEHGALPPPQS